MLGPFAGAPESTVTVAGIADPDGATEQSYLGIQLSSDGAERPTRRAPRWRA
jgi:hypothetical protein